MLVLGISGSPRKNGNTDFLVNKALEGSEREGAAVEFIGMAGMDVRGCLACPKCGEGACVIDDDMQRIYPRMEAADAIIIGSPVYFGTMTSQTKALVDRSYFLLKAGKKLEGKVGGMITVGGRAGHDLTAVSLMNFFTIQGMILPPNSFAQSFSREKGAAEREDPAIKGVISLGERVYRLAEKLSSQGGHDLEYP